MNFIDILNKLKIKIFADGADIHKILSLSDVEYIKGFTTNPSLMRKSEYKIMKNLQDLC